MPRKIGKKRVSRKSRSGFSAYKEKAKIIDAIREVGTAIDRLKRLFSALDKSDEEGASALCEELLPAYRTVQALEAVGGLMATAVK